MHTRMLVSVAAALLMLGSHGARLDAQASTTVCKDGSTSTATGKGACSGHGGVDAKATAAAHKAVKTETKAAAKTAKTEGKTEAKSAQAESKAAARTAKAEEKSETKAATQVTCSDGSTSTAGRGACSGHGGVKKAAAATAAPSLPAAVPANSPARERSEAKSNATAKQQSSARGEDKDPTGAIAQCKDGLYSHATTRRGACSKHGGVDKWLKP